MLYEGITIETTARSVGPLTAPSFREMVQPPSVSFPLSARISAIPASMSAQHAKQRGRVAGASRQLMPTRQKM